MQNAIAISFFSCFFVVTENTAPINASGFQEAVPCDE